MTFPAQDHRNGKDSHHEAEIWIRICLAPKPGYLGFLKFKVSSRWGGAGAQSQEGEVSKLFPSLSDYWGSHWLVQVTKWHLNMFQNHLAVFRDSSPSLESMSTKSDRARQRSCELDIAYSFSNWQTISAKFSAKGWQIQPWEWKVWELAWNDSHISFLSSEATVCHKTFKVSAWAAREPKWVVVPQAKQSSYRIGDRKSRITPPNPQPHAMDVSCLSRMQAQRETWHVEQGNWVKFDYGHWGMREELRLKFHECPSYN